VTVASITRRWVAERLPDRPDRAHKGTFGRVLVVGGSIDYPGAALLTALGAMRAGAGVVRVAAAESVVARLAGSIPEVTWMSLDEEAPGLIAPGGWRRVTAESAEYDAAVIGPGLGRQPATQRRTRQLAAAIRIPTVVDADGLNALAGGSRWWQGLRAALVLTPHPGEFARLTGAEAPEADDDDGRAAAAGDAARDWNQIVVLKGARSVVAAPDGTLLRSDVATAALATAGSGDVLAGAVAALLAAGTEPLVAAACAVAIHAKAGLLAAERLGRAGVIATDIAALLPEAIEHLRGDGGR
jgi:NAD(P)H-hydrate epimerase